MARTLLVAVDFSDASRIALDAAAELAKDLHARLVVVHAYSQAPRMPESVDSPLVDPTDKARMEIQLDEAVELSTHWADKLRGQGLDVVTVAREGPAVDVVLEEADKHGATLIVAGTHGWRGLKRFVLGSVAETLVKKSHLPVLVVPWPRE